MKNPILTSFFALALFSMHTGSLSADIMTRINSIATQAMRYSDQIRLNFDDSVKYDVTASDGSCVLSLYNVPYTSASAANLAKKLKNSSSNIANVSVDALANESSDKEGSQLVITFKNNNIHLNVHALEHPHQLVIDVVSSDLLSNKLNNRTGVIAHALNGLHACYAAQILI